MEDLKAIDCKSLEYNKVVGKMLREIIYSKFYLQNYLGKG